MGPVLPVLVRQLLGLKVLRPILLPQGPLLLPNPPRLLPRCLDLGDLLPDGFGAFIFEGIPQLRLELVGEEELLLHFRKYTKFRLTYI